MKTVALLLASLWSDSRYDNSHIAMLPDERELHSVYMKLLYRSDIEKSKLTLLYKDIYWHAWQLKGNVDLDWSNEFKRSCVDRLIVCIGERNYRLGKLPNVPADY